MGLFQLSGSPAGTVDTTRRQQVGQNLRQPVLDQLSGTLQGDYLHGGPAFNAAQQAAANRITPQVQSAFSGAGRLNSGLAQTAMTQALGDSFAGLYNNERNRQLQAANIAPSVEGEQTLSEPYFENDLATALGLLGAGGSLLDLFGGGGSGGGVGGLLGGIGDAAGGIGDLLGLGGAAGALDLGGLGAGDFVVNNDGGFLGMGGNAPDSFSGGLDLGNLFGNAGNVGAAVGAGIGASGAAMTPAALAAMGYPGLASSLASGGSLGLAASGPLGAGLGGGATPATLAGLEAATGGAASAGGAAGGLGGLGGTLAAAAPLAIAALPIAGVLGQIFGDDSSKVRKQGNQMLAAAQQQFAATPKDAQGFATLNLPGLGPVRVKKDPRQGVNTFVRDDGKIVTADGGNGNFVATNPGLTNSREQAERTPMVYTARQMAGETLGGWDQLTPREQEGITRGQLFMMMRGGGGGR